MAEDAPRPSKLAYALYYCICFFTFWFGAHRFDRDGDGDFDPEDVMAYLQDSAAYAERCFKQSKTGKARARKAVRKIAHRKADMRKAARKKILEEKQRARAEGRTWDPAWESEASLDAVINEKIEGASAAAQISAKYMERQIPPWFVLVECLLCFGFWLAFAIKQAVEDGADMLSVTAGLDNVKDGHLDLRWASPDCESHRSEIWRWLTYQWTHAGSMEVMSNVLVVLLLGVPLEGYHGFLRMAAIFNLGVIGGAGCYFVGDAHTAVVGCSGGCYALMGWHLADLILNWSVKKFRVTTLIFLVVIAVAELVCYGFGSPGESRSFSAHFGGAVVGLMVGALLGKNLKEFAYARYVQGALGVIVLVLAGFVVIWLGISDGPINIFEAAAGESPWCWIRQVYGAQVNLDQWECVRCWSRSCVQQWSSLDRVVMVNKDSCDAQGYHYIEER